MVGKSWGNNNINVVIIICHLNRVNIRQMFLKNRKLSWSVVLRRPYSDKPQYTLRDHQLCVNQLLFSQSHLQYSLGQLLYSKSHVQYSLGQLLYSKSHLQYSLGQLLYSKSHLQYSLGQLLYSKSHVQCNTNQHLHPSRQHYIVNNHVIYIKSRNNYSTKHGSTIAES